MKQFCDSDLEYSLKKPSLKSYNEILENIKQ